MTAKTAMMSITMIIITMMKAKSTTTISSINGKRARLRDLMGAKGIRSRAGIDYPF
jgi:hypothetical protein